ncbi:MAG: hypothetical protein ABR987_20760 [Terracidiphilus sp.]|jgi:hypothetical protein
MFEPTEKSREKVAQKIRDEISQVKLNPESVAANMAFLEQASEEARSKTRGQKAQEQAFEKRTTLGFVFWVRAEQMKSWLTLGLLPMHPVAAMFRVQMKEARKVKVN